MDCKKREITGSVQAKNGLYYLSINFYVDGKRKPKMFNTKLETKGYNKRKAEEMLRLKLKEINGPETPPSEEPAPEAFGAWPTPPVMQAPLPQPAAAHFPLSAENSLPEGALIQAIDPTAHSAAAIPAPAGVLYAGSLPDYRAFRYGRKAYPGDSMEVSQYFERWIARVKKSVRRNTWNQYRTTVMKRIVPYFAGRGLMLSDVEPHHAQAFLDDCAALHRLDGKQGELSPTTVRRIYAVLSKAFRDATRLQEIPYNPVASVQPPQNNVYHASYYTAEQMNLFLAEARKSFAKAPLLLCAYYGLRRSEAVGLKWDAVDFAAKTMTIRHTITVDECKALIKADITKTKSSRRSLPLLPEIETMLLAEQARQAELRELFGESHNAKGYVCIREDGNVIHPNKVTMEYRAVCKRAGLPKTRLHDLRHTNASLLVKNSCNLKEIQRWMGHSDIKTTGNLYSHLETDDLAHVGGVICSSLQPGA